MGGFIPFLPVCGTGASVFCPWTWMYTTSFHASQALALRLELYVWLFWASTLQTADCRDSQLLQNQYYIHRGIAEMNTTIKNLKDVGFLSPTTFSCNSPNWPIQRTDGRLTLDYHKPIPDVVSLCELINTYPGA